MKILIIGGTGFIGPHLLRQLIDQGHQLAVFHRGTSSDTLPHAVKHILGDRQLLADHREELRRFAPQVVIDLVLSSGRQAECLMEMFRGVAGRVIGISSIDVYRWQRAWRTATGAFD